MDRGELQATLAWWSLPSVGDRTLIALLQHGRKTGRGLAALWHAPATDLKAAAGLRPAALAALAFNAAALWQQAGEDAEVIRERGVELLRLGEPEYPPALAAAGLAWPVVFAFGALGLLEEPRAALLNSQQVTAAGLAVTEAIADALARRDVALVASTNRESYQAAAVAAKRHAGPSVLVLDRGVVEAFPAGLQREPVAGARVWDAEFDPELQLLLAPFAWRAKWHARSGPLRDALICTLAHVLIAVDVRPGGTVEEQCRRAAERGAVVLAIDRGEDTPAGTRELWDVPGVLRHAWRGAETAANEVLARLPGRTDSEAAPSGVEREVALFLARACEALDRRGDRARPSTRAVAGLPANSALARAAAAWCARGADLTAGAAWLLADLSAETSPLRVAQLLRRVARGGLLAAVVPSAWLENPEVATARAEWLREAALRAIVRLPGDPHAAGAPCAVLFLERDGRAEAPVPSFEPAAARMGRFHRRRYLLHVIDSLSGAPERPGVEPGVG